jgi:hypothetical protein
MKHIFMELSPDQLLSLLGELHDFDRGHRIRIYRLCAEYEKRMKQ